MISKLQILLFSTLLLYIDCACNPGHFTKNSACDTKATRIKCKDYTSTTIKGKKWHYYYMSLDGIEGNVELDFKLDGPNALGYIRFQPDDKYKLPSDGSYDYALLVKEGGREIPSESLTSFKNIKGGQMLLGIRNPSSSNLNVEIRYFTEEGDCKRPLSALILGLIIGISTIFIVGCCVAASICITAKIRGRNGRSTRRVHNLSEIIQFRAQLHIQVSDILTLQELEKYFPKKPFKTLENPFQQTGCSVCLEEFLPDILCHQLYCNHIFHETCVQKWLEKHHNCPDCRVPIGKKVIEEFFKAKAQKKEQQVHQVEEEVQMVDIVENEK